ncbi:hypothetical protein Ac2012v2_003069 [Leucoagaricus gongylophorus]
MPFFIVSIPSTIHIHHPEISSLPICFPLLLPMHVRRSDGDDLHCGSGGGADDLLGLRIASVFIILIGSLMGALFPVIAKHSSWIKIPKPLFDFAKYFGSGVIIATAFIHLLSPGMDALTSPCLPDSWQDYPYALAFCLVSIFGIFVVELVVFRWGTRKLAKIGQRHDAHGHQHGGHAAHGPEGLLVASESQRQKRTSDVESLGTEKTEHNPHQHGDETFLDAGLAHVLGIAILEFGVVLHSVLIGLTLAVDEDFKILFVVLVFHQTFEGMGIGSRLAYMKLPASYSWVPYAGAILYGFTTPIGIAVGLGVRTLYNPGSTTASIVSGTLDSLSSGILVYTGLVELLAHEFLFNKEMIQGSNRKVALAVGSVAFGCGIMALLGRWA